MAPPQLDGFVAAVLDADMIGPNVMILGRRGVLLQIERAHGDFDRSSRSEYIAQEPIVLVARPSRRASDHAPQSFPEHGRHNVGSGRTGFKAAAIMRHVFSRLLTPPGASRASTFSSGRREPSGWIDWMQTWSAPASQCSWMRRWIALLAAPGDIGVDETVGAAARHLVVAESQAPPVIDVIVELQIRRQRLAGRRAGFFGVGFEQYPDLGA